MHFPPERSAQSKQTIRISDKIPFFRGETKDHRVASRFGRIGNCAVRNAESFSNGAIRPGPRRSNSDGKRANLCRTPLCAGFTLTRTISFLIDSGQRRRRMLVILFFLGRETYPPRQPRYAFIRRPLSCNLSLRNCRRPTDYLEANSQNKLAAGLKRPVNP